VGADSGIVWLAIHDAVLDEATQLVEQRRVREDLGAVHDPDDAIAIAGANAGVAAASDAPAKAAKALTAAAKGGCIRPPGEQAAVDAAAATLAAAAAAAAAEPEMKADEMHAVYLAPPIQMSPIDNPVAIKVLLESERAKESIRATQPGHKRSSGLDGVLRTLDLVHSRWLLTTALWEIEVLEKATLKWQIDFNLQGPSAKQKHSAAVKAASKRAADEPNAAPACYFRLGHHVDELALPLLHLVGLKEKDLEIDFRSNSGVCLLLQDPLAQHTRSGEQAQKLGYVLQLALLRRHLLAVALEYNVTHMDSLLVLHNVRAKTTEMSTLAHNPVATLEAEWKIRIDGSVEPQLKHKKTTATADEVIKESALEDEGKKKIKHLARPGGLEPPRWPLLGLLPCYHARLSETLVTASGIMQVAESLATIPYAASYQDKIERVKHSQMSAPYLHLTDVTKVTRRHHLLNVTQMSLKDSGIH